MSGYRQFKYENMTGCQMKGQLDFHLLKEWATTEEEA